MPSPAKREARQFRRHRIRSIFESAPNVGPRESSLYLPYYSEPEVPLGLPTPRRQTEPYHPAPSSSTFDIPQTGFFDTQAHTDIWDEVFDSAAHTTKGRVESHQQTRKRLVSASVLQLNVPVALADTRVFGLVDRAMKSEIWSKVRFFSWPFRHQRFFHGVSRHRARLASQLVFPLSFYPFPYRDLSSVLTVSPPTVCSDWRRPVIQSTVELIPSTSAFILSRL